MYETKIPRFFDSHNHPSLYLLLSNSPSLENVQTREEADGILNALPAEALNLCLGWHKERFSIAEDELEKYPPVVIVNSCLHGFLANSSAWRIIGEAGIPNSNLDETMREKVFGDILQLVGRWRPCEQVMKMWPQWREEWQRLGLYGAADMASLYPGFSDGEFSLEHWQFAGKGQDWELHPGIAGIKLFNDGALGARTAALRSGYCVPATPFLTYSDAELRERFFTCFRKHRCLALHTIGDAAIEQALRIYREVKPQLQAEGIDSLLRLEHCECMDLEQAKIAKRLQVVLCMQPNFSSDAQAHRDILTEERCRQLNSLRLIIDSAGFVPGEDLLFGSDGLPTGVVAALQSALFPIFEGQRLSLEELLAGYRADAKYGTVTVAIDEEKGEVELL